MDLSEKTKQLCKTYNIKPARSKGQNFLIKEEIYDKIVAAADLEKEDTILEVGPGLGFLTVKLARKVKKVVAVELDDKLAGVLKTDLLTKGITNVEVVNKSILEFKPPPTPLLKGGERGFKIVANLPYNITSIFLRKFLSEEHKPALMVLMLQKEVAERICATAGEMSLLAVSVQFYAKAEIIQIVSKENFWPMPEVDSAIVRIIPHSPQIIRKLFSTVIPAKAGIQNSVDTTTFLDPRVSARGGSAFGGKPEDDKREFLNNLKEKEFFRLVKIGFSAKRKMLKNNLANGFHISNGEAADWLKQAGFNEKIRAQEFSVGDWIKLFGVASKNML